MNVARRREAAYVALPVDDLFGRNERTGVARGQAEALLLLLALMDSGDAPGEMVVDLGALSGEPDKGHD